MSKLSTAQNKRWMQLRADIEIHQPHEIDGTPVAVQFVSFTFGKAARWELRLLSGERLYLGKNAVEALEALERLIDENFTLLLKPKNAESVTHASCETNTNTILGTGFPPPCGNDGVRATALTITPDSLKLAREQQTKTEVLLQSALYAPINAAESEPRHCGKDAAIQSQGGDSDDGQPATSGFCFATAYQHQLKRLAKKVLTIGTRVKFAYGSEPWAFSKNPEKVWVIEDIKLFIKDDYHVTHFVICLQGRKNPVCVTDLINADESDANEVARYERRKNIVVNQQHIIH